MKLLIRKTLICILIIIILLNTINLSAITNSVYAVHETTIPEDCIPIYTAEDLQNIENNLSGNYILMNNIDMSTKADFVPISNFTGNFNGNGYTIKNLTSALMITVQNASIYNLKIKDIKININSIMGGYAIFSSLQNSILRDIEVENLEINSTKEGLGGICGSVHSCTLQRIKLSGKNSLTATGFSARSMRVGLLAMRIDGINEESIVNDIVISGENSIHIKLDPTTYFDDYVYVGLLAGWLNAKTSNIRIIGDNTLICEDLNNNTSMGGIAGEVVNEISNIKITGNTKIKNIGTNNEKLYVGGIAGWAVGIIMDDCYANTEISVGEVTSNTVAIGGLIGRATDIYSETGTENVSVSYVETRYYREYDKNLKQYVDKTKQVASGNKTVAEGRTVTPGITNCGTKVKITDYSINGKTGGLIGSTSAVGVEKSWSMADITSSTNESVGGLIGEAGYTNKISQSFAKGLINKTNSGNVGGLIGHAYSYAWSIFGDGYGNITASTSKAKYANNIHIDNTYTDVQINGPAGTTGGLIGTSYTNTTTNTGTSTSGSDTYKCVYSLTSKVTIDNSYAIGEINATSGTKKGIAGELDTENTIITNTYWSPDTVGLNASQTGETAYAKTNSQLHDKSNYSGWNFSNIWAIQPNGESLAYLRMYNPLIIQKYEKDTTTPVSEALIGIFKENDTLVTEDITDINGEAYFYLQDLNPGTYYYKETKAPKGYYLNDEKYYFTIDSNRQITLNDGANGIIYDEVNNEVQKADNVVITKYKKDSNIVVPNAELGLCNSEGELLDEFETLTTDENGQVNLSQIADFPEGTYFYKEVTAPQGYILNENIYSFEVDEDGEVYFGENGGRIYNEKIKAPTGQESAKIIKCRTGTTTVLPGAKIELYDSSKTTKLDEFITDENGQIDFASTGKLEACETYYYKETQAPAGYVLDDTWKQIVVDSTGLVTLTQGNILYNDRVTAQPGSIVITKVDEKTNKALSNAEIGLCDEEGTILINSENEEVKYLTDENGQIDFTTKILLEPGTYYFREVTAPEGYVLDETVHSFIVNNDGSVTFVEENGNILENEQKLYLKTSEYQICETQMRWEKGTKTEYKQGDKYISKVPDMTTLSTFIENLETNGTPLVKNRKGQSIAENDYVGTGMTLTVTKGEEKIEITIVVTGDVSGDGTIQIDDLSTTMTAYWEEMMADIVELMAIDFDDNGKIGLDDYATERIILYDRM